MEKKKLWVCKCSLLWRARTEAHKNAARRHLGHTEVTQTVS